MNGHSSYVMFGLGPDRYLLGGSFAPNGGSAPDPASFRGREGLPFTVAYEATGIFTVTLPEGFTLPAQPHFILVSAQAADAAAWFEVMVVGETLLNTATKSFVIQAHRSGTANAPAAAAGTRINFAIFTQNNTGR
jgi:hypothetical protein